MRLLLLLTVACCAGKALSAFPAETNTFLGTLQTCSNDAQSDIDCITRLEDTLQTASDYIQKVRDLKIVLGKINDGFNTMSTVTRFATLVPGTSALVRVVDNVVSSSSDKVSAAYSKVEAIDAKIWPYKARCDSGVEKCDQANTLLNSIKSKCNTGTSAFTTARNCASGMSSGSLTTSLRNGLEGTSAGLDSQLDTLLIAMGNIGAGCDEFDSFVNTVSSWANLDGILAELNSFFDVFEPILTFFKDLQELLEREFCVPRTTKCFSAEDVINAVSSWTRVLREAVDKLVDELLERIPLPDLPGLPDLDIIIDFNLNFDMPTLNLDFDINDFNPFLSLTWDCAVEVQNLCSAGTGALSIECGGSDTPDDNEESESETVDNDDSSYLGCVVDTWSRALPVQVEVENADVTKCRAACASRSYKYSGNQHAYQCFCGDGDNYARHGRANDADCNRICPGNSGQKCGGFWRMSVYSSGYLGCFEDRGSRDLPEAGLWQMGNSATVDRCVERCRDRGYKYAGAQYFSQCFCGNSHNSYGEKPKAECNAPCKGDDTQMCGGTWRNAIYSTGN